MEKNKIGIIGYGHVGKAAVDMFKDDYDILVYDPQYNEERNFENVSFVSDIGDIKNCVMGVICAPTPANENGECDISIVENSVAQLNVPVILIKSTIAPGTTEKLKEKTGKRIVFSPEYIGESKYWNPYFNDDMKAVPFVILGGDKKDTQYIHDILLPFLGPTKTYFQTSSINAEIIKYMENTYFATKVTFVNEMYEICNSFGADWTQVREGWLLDPRVERMHTAVFPDNRGFAGKCYPKDLSALIHASKKVGYSPEFLEGVKKSNERFRLQKMDEK